jgi:putative transposase
MPTRRTLSHTPPASVPDGSWFFLTLCCAERGRNQLCLRETGNQLLEDGARYHRQGVWHLYLLLLMPDHLHMIAAFPVEVRMSDAIRNWKRLTARMLGVKWQRNYFDHRLRADEGLELKADYIRQNPVRAGLVQTAEEWPFYVDIRKLEGG